MEVGNSKKKTYSNLKSSPFFPFSLHGELCPLLADGNLLLEFYEESGERSAIKQFCKKTSWPGKPSHSIAFSRETLMSLLISLFNSDDAREKLKIKSKWNSCLLYHVIWAWLSRVNNPLYKRLRKNYCHFGKDKRIFLSPKDLKQFLTELKNDDPGDQYIRCIAITTLAFCTLQPEDRLALGEIFLEHYPHYLGLFSPASKGNKALQKVDELEPISTNAPKYDKAFQEVGELKCDKESNLNAAENSLSSLESGMSENLKEILELIKQYEICCKSCLKEIPKLSTDAGLLDEKFNSIIKGLQERRECFINFTKKIQGESSKAVIAVKNACSRYPFPIDTSKIESKITAPNLGAPDCLGLKQRIQDLSLIWNNLSLDDNKLLNYEGLEKDFQNLVKKDESAGIDILKMETRKSVEWHNRQEELRRWATDLDSSIANIKDKIEESKRTEAQYNHLRDELKTISLNQDFVSSLSFEDLDRVVSLLDDTPEAAKLAGIFIYIMLEKDFSEGLLRFENLLDNFGKKKKFYAAIFSILPLEILLKIIDSDTSLARVILFHVFAWDYQAKSFSLVYHYNFRSNFCRPEIGNTRSFFEMFISLLDHEHLTSGEQIKEVLFKKMDDFEEIASQSEKKFIAFSTNPPGLRGLFHSLRMIAWNSHFRNLVKHVKNCDHEFVENIYNSSINRPNDDIWREIVEKSDIKPTMKALLMRNINDKLYLSFFSYFKEGKSLLEKVLMSWKNLDKNDSDGWFKLRKLANELNSGEDLEFDDPQWLENSIRNLLFCEESDINPVDLNFGQMILVNSNNPWLSDWNGKVDAIMPRAFIEKQNLEKPRLVTIANDLISKIYSKKSREDLLKHYYKSNGCSLAMLAIDDFAEIGVVFDNQFTRKIEKEYKVKAEQLEERLHVADKNTNTLRPEVKSDIGNYLEMAKKLLNKRKLEEAEDWTEQAEGDIENALDDMKNSSIVDGNEAKSKLIIDWLEKAGCLDLDSLDLGQMESLKKKILKENSLRLNHLDTLSSLCKSNNLPSEVKTYLRQLKINLSSPDLWPDTGDNAEYIGMLIDDIYAWLTNWWGHQEDFLPKTKKALVDVAKYLQDNISTLILDAIKKEKPLDSKFAQLANFGWDKARKPEHIWDELIKNNFVNDKSLSAADNKEISNNYYDYSDDGSSFDLSAIRSEVEPEEMENPFNLLKNNEYKKVCSASAMEFRRLEKEGNIQTPQAKSLLALYSISSILASKNLSNSEIIDYLIFVATQVSKNPYLLELLNKALWLKLLALDHLLEVSSGWKELWERSPEDTSRHFLSRLLSSQDSLPILELLWKGRMKEKDNRLRRVSLLCLLDSDGRWELFECFINKVAPRALKTLLINFVRVLKSKNLDATANLPLIARGIEDKTKSLSSAVPYMPWVEFVRLKAHADLSSAPITLNLSDNLVLEKVENGWQLYLQIVPREIDYPASLSIKIGEGTVDFLNNDNKAVRKLQAAEDLLSNQPFTWSIMVKTKNDEKTEEGTHVLPILISGTTLTGSKFEENYDLKVTFGVECEFNPPGNYEIDDAYPGVTGNPVSPGEGFCGRESYLEKIDSIIRNSRSLWVTGVRRIGKTSILLHVAKFYGHEAERPIGIIYVPLEDFDYKNNSPKSFSQQFFSFIRSMILEYPRNNSLRLWFSKRGVNKELLTKAFDGIGSDESGGVSIWLPQMADELTRLSKGKLTRFLILMDEVDQLEKHWRKGFKDEVSKLFWGLRNVSQQASNVSLIMAGSNLANRYINDYEQAFYGSIGNLTISGYEIPKELSAARNVFLPPQMEKGYFSISDEVLMYVIKTCNGIPYFIALLGDAVVRITKHRQITRNSMDAAIKALIWGHDNLLDSEAHNKFTKTLEDLSILPSYERVRTEIFLMYMAQNVSVSFPEVSEGKVISHISDGVGSVDPEEWRASRKICIQGNLIEGPIHRLKFVIPIMGEALSRMARDDLPNRIEQLIKLKKETECDTS